MADVLLPGGSALTFGAAHGVIEHSRSTRRREAAVAAARSFDKLYDSLYYYGGPKWDVTLSASVSPSENSGGGGEMMSLATDLNLSFRPSDRLTVTSSLGVAGDSPRGPGTGTRSIYSALPVWYAALRNLDLSLYGGYSRSSTSDGHYDGRTLNAVAGLVWYLRREAPFRTSVAVDVGYSRYLDAASSSGYAELYGLVALRIAGF